MTGLSDALAQPAYTLAPATLLSPEGPRRDSVIAIADGQIQTIQNKSDYREEHPENEVIELPDCAIVPGFIDSHIHLGQGFGKAVIGGEPSQIWQRIWIPLEGNLDPDLVYVSAKWMMLEALRGGYTGLVDFAIVNEEKTKAIHRAARECGIRLVSTTGAVNKAAYEDVTGKKAEFKQLDEALKRADLHFSLCAEEGNIYPSLCVSGVQGASMELIGALAGYCADRSGLFQIHANEHIPEVHACIVEHGCRPVEYIADSGGLGPHTILHHATLVTETEIELIRSTGSGVSYNPVASLWKGDAVTPAMAFAERGVRFGLGTDSTRSDGFRMLDAAEACQRLTFGMRINDFSAGAAWTWVDAAFRGSADVAGLKGTTGELAAGQKADFLILDTSAPEVLPSWDFQWELVRHYNRDQIRSVVIDGAMVMENGRAANWDQDLFLAEELPNAIQTVKTSPIVRRHGTSEEHRSRRESRKSANS